MIAGLRSVSDVAVNLSFAKPVSEGRAEEEVVDSQSGVPRKAIPEVIPERVDFLVWVQGAQGVSPSLSQQTRVAFDFGVRLADSLNDPQMSSRKRLKIRVGWMKRPETQ